MGLFLQVRGLLMASSRKKIFLRTALSPNHAPKSKSITPAMEREIAKRQAERDQKPPKPK